MASAGTYALARAAKRMASLNLGAAKDAAAALTSYGLRSADASRVLSPALVVHLDKVRHNVKTMIHGQMGGNALKWRPHVKTVKTPAILRELIAAGVRRFKCATPREADVLCATLREAGVAGESDVLIAFPHVGPNLTRLGQVAAEYGEVRMSMLVETVEAVADVPPQLSVFVDVNPEMDRTGMPLVDAEAGGAAAVAAAVGPERFRGVHFYCGHSSKWHSTDERLDQLAPLYDRLLALSSTLSAAGTPCGELCTSGTPSVPCSLAYKPLNHGDVEHTVAPGTVVLADATTMELCPDLPLVPAAVVATRVVSHPAAGMFTCDVGSKAIAAEIPKEHGVGMFVGHTPGYHPLGPSEEHLPVRVASGVPVPERGSLQFVVPTHVCPTVNLAETMILADRQPHDGGSGADDWEGFAGIVGAVPVAARAHEALL